MKKYDLSIHFQTKTQSIEEIDNKFNEWLNSENYKGQFDFSERLETSEDGKHEFKEPRSVLHHCFLKRQDLKTIALSPEKISLIESTLDFLDFISEDIVQWKGTSVYEDALCWDRKYMLENIKKLNGISIFIGEIIDGVKEEYDIAQELGVDCVLIP